MSYSPVTSGATVEGIKANVVSQPADDTTSAFLVKRPDVTWANNVPYGSGQVVELLTEVDVPPGLTSKGAYNAGTTYAVFDSVTYSGSTYYSLVAGNVGNQPDTHPTQWATLPSDSQIIVDRGAYNAGTTYSKWDRVSSGGTLWLSMQASNTGNTPAILSPWWQPATGPGSMIMRLDGAGGLGVSNGIHLPYGLRRTQYSDTPDAVTGAFWIQKFADVTGLVISNPTKPTVASPTKGYVSLLDARGDVVSAGKPVLDVNTSGVLSVYASNGTTAVATLAPGDAGTSGARLILQAGAAGTIPLAVLGFSGQTADLFQVYDTPGGTLLSRFGKGGRFGTSVTTAPADADVRTSEAMLWVDTSVTGKPVMRVRGKDAAGTASDMTPSQPQTHISIPFGIVPLATSSANDSAFIATAWMNGVRFNTGGLQNDILEWDVALSAGTWRMEIFYAKASNYAIVTPTFDGTGLATFDQYNATASQSVAHYTGISVTTPGTKRLQLKSTSKNASSSSYLMAIALIAFTKTA